LDSHPYDALRLAQGGQLIFTPCPGTRGVDMQASIAQLRQAGAQAVITLMPDAEMARLDVESLPEACRKNGLHWLHLPVEDDASPTAEFQQLWEQKRAQVHRILDAQGGLAIHCKGGSGRTGLMAAIILIERGNTLEQATAMVKGLRPKSLRLQAHLDYLSGVTGVRHEGEAL